MSNAVFCPAPKGFYSVESFRVYEALESGCIPLVDNPEDRPSYWKDVLGAEAVEHLMLVEKGG